MKRDEFCQLTWWIIVPFTIAIIYLPIDYLFNIDGHKVSIAQCIIDMLLLIVILANFYRIKIRVGESTIKILYGVGLIKREIQLNNISSVKSVQNKSILNFDLKTINKGSVYNIFSRRAVEVITKEKRTIVRIGVANPDKLKELIGKRIA